MRTPKNTAKTSEHSWRLAQHGTKVLAFVLCAQTLALGCGARSIEPSEGLAGASPEPGASGQGGMNTEGNDDAGSVHMSTAGTGGAGGIGGAGGLGGGGGAVGLDASVPGADDYACKALSPFQRGACIDTSDESIAALAPGEPFSGVVESIDLNPPSCSGFGEIYGTDGMHSFTVSDGDRSLVVTLKLPWSTPLVSVGDAIEVEQDYRFDQWVPPTGRLVLRDAEGSVLLWLQQVIGGPSTLLPPPGMSATDGATACSFDDYGCGINTRKSLLAGAGSSEADIPFGGSADVGDYVFVNGDNIDFEFTGGCTDTGSYHKLLVAAVRGSLDSLAARDIGPCGGEATSDIPSRDIAEGICDPEGLCTICEQEHDDAGAVVAWSVYTEDCACP